MVSKNQHVGSSFDDFLKEEGIRDEVDNVAVKKAISLGLQEHMRTQNITKTEMAAILGTSRSQLNRVLDPNTAAVTLTTLTRAASAIGKKLKMELA